MSVLVLAVVALVIFAVVAAVALLLLAANRRSQEAAPAPYVPPQPQIPVYPEDEPTGPADELPDAYPAPRQWPPASGPTGDVTPRPGAPGWGPHQDWEKRQD